jgi:hypothetical protein
LIISTIWVEWQRGGEEYGSGLDNMLMIQYNE